MVAAALIPAFHFAPTPLKEALDGGAAALEIIETLNKMAAHAHADGGRLSVHDIVQAIPAQTANSCSEIAKEVRDIKKSFIKADISLEKPISDLWKDSSILKAFFIPSYRTINHARKRLEDIKSDLIELHTEFIAAIQCTEQYGVLIKSYDQARAESQSIEQLITTQVPVGQVFETLIVRAEHLAAQLRDANTKPP